ncbi:HK97 gp10 family phage protein [Cytobacillus praedii]|uniref:HK97 gp10 family phage protein n=1 Tax=Cytobacillus praedii TaxID=1742358 RepID=UPI002E1E0A2F|nr:HK97 gp10 family phage protein [Cytobacillus praedii]
MANNRYFTIDGLDDWQRGLMAMNGAALDRTKDRILRTTALRLQEYLDDLTPARTGRLRGSMNVGQPGNVFEIEVGNRSYVFVGTNVEYAQYVNDGFEQEKGRFVPGEWRSGTFHYIPWHHTGMVLTGKVIPGARMFEKSMDYVEDDMERIIEFEFRRLYRELFD